MSQRSGSPSSEGEGDEIRPHGDSDSSEEEEDDPEEAQRIAEGFIADEDDEEDGEGDDEARRRARKRARKARRRRQREEREKDAADLSDDELQLIRENQERENRGARPAKRVRRGSQDDDEGPEGLQDMFKDDRVVDDEDEDDLGDFIEEDEDVQPGETEEQRRERKREEKLKRRQRARERPELQGVDRVAMDEVYAVFGDGHEYDWALEGDAGDFEEDEEPAKKELRLEDVFDPSELKARHLLDEDRAIAQKDWPERQQLINSTLSDNPVLASISLYPPPNLAAGWAFNKISTRTQYLFCGQHDQWPEPSPMDPNPIPAPRRDDLAGQFVIAVQEALDMMFVQHYEVPYVWHYKRDALSLMEQQSEQQRGIVQFLERDELWTLYGLGTRFHAIYDRNVQIREMWGKIKARRTGLEDPYLEQTLLGSRCNLSIEAAADGYEWLAYHYAVDMRRVKEDEALEEGGKRLPEKSSIEDLRQGPIMALVKAFGVSVPEVATSFNDPNGTVIPPVNASQMPEDLAAEYAGDGTSFLTTDDAIKAASGILATELAKDPAIRQQAREFMEICATVTVTPTDRGMSIIDQYHLYYTFKFLLQKPASAFRNSPQFLYLLQAEAEGLITVSIDIDADSMANFEGALGRCVQVPDFTGLGTAWNEVRSEMVKEAINKNLIPMAHRWLRENLKGQAEDFVADTCRAELEYRVNVRPYATAKMEAGDIPSVLAITNGRGDFKDAVMAVMLDDVGRMSTQAKFDNLRDEADKEAFIALLERRKPKVVVIGGLSAQTSRLREAAATALRQVAINKLGSEPPAEESYAIPEDFTAAMTDYDLQLAPYLTPLEYVPDQTARIYMHSDEAEKEFPNLPINGRFALGLARYAQNPLNAYCKLGKDIASVSFLEMHQKMIPQEKLLIHLERGLVNSVCAMGIEINSCVIDPYQRAMLPFVAGLGPRKADLLINAVLRTGDVVNRLQLAGPGFFGPTVFENSVGFLSIETDLDSMQLEKENTLAQPDPLDKTRIHPADYEFAQKMCQDLLELDADDVEDQHPSDVVLQVMQLNDRQRRLGELELDDFAFNLQRQGNNKRYALSEIVNELISYRADRRRPFMLPDEWDVLTMLTGESKMTIGHGMRVTFTVRKAMSNRVFGQLESGIDAVLERDLAIEDGGFETLEELFKPRQSLKAIVVSAEPARLQVRISTRSADVAQGVTFQQPFGQEYYNNAARQQQAEDAAAAKKRREAGSVKRVVNHPNWYTMNSGQAEQFLASQHRGDVVIRPSSKGADHIAVTWKVDDDVFQHIDVQEIDKPNEYTLGRILRVANRFSYADLDELIINHVKATARKFDEMQVHEKYRPEDELESFLRNYVQAHPGRSMYGFSIDSGRPGYLKLCFLNRSTKDGGVIQTWPVKVLPGAYSLNNAEVPGVTELCNAFKAQYSSRLAEQGSGGKTPGIRTGKTPMHGGKTPGGRTPGIGMVGGRTPMPGVIMGGRTPMPGMAMGRTPMRPGMTPNPYGGAPVRAGAGYTGGATPYGGGYPPQAGGHGQPPPPGAGWGGGPPPGSGWGGGPPPGQGYGAPIPPPGNGFGGPPPPARPPMGMNPERAAMIARQSGGDQDSGGW